MDSIPLVRIESGTLFCLDNTCFVRPVDESQELAESKLESTLSKSKSSKTDKKEKKKKKVGESNQPDAKGSSAGTAIVGGQSDPLSRSSIINPESERPSYHIELVFTSSCIYLRLALQDLKNALKEQDYETTVGLYHF